MFKEKHISQQSFDALLNWLDSNRDAAGGKYEIIRKRLIRVFVGRGCPEPEALADETLSRVTQKFPELGNTYDGDPVKFFYGVANKVHQEWLRHQPKLSELVNEPAVPLPTDDLELDCLERCLDELPADQRSLIVEYYRGEGASKIVNRRDLAESYNITANALHVRASRIRGELRDCIERCIRANNL